MLPTFVDQNHLEAIKLAGKMGGWGDGTIFILFIGFVA